MATHASGYFLLADDHALVAEAAEHTLGEIFRTGLFGVYRPLGFVVAKAVGLLRPGSMGWSAVVLSLHACNAALLYVTALRIGYPALAAATASALFLWSPWSSEAYLWFSGIFDVGAAFGILLALTAITAPRSSLPAAVSTVIAAVGGCVIAAGFKENGYLAAALVPTLALSGFTPRPYRRVAVTALLAALCAVGVFLYRTQLLAATATPYSASEFGGRLLSVTAVPAAASNVRGLLLWPVPAVWGDASRLLATMVVWPLGAALTAGLALLAVATRWRAWLQLAAIAVSLAPTAFLPIAVATITPRRYLYMAGVPLCLLISGAIAARQRREPAWSAVGLSMPLAGLFLAAILATVSQVTLWRMATGTARCAMEDFDTRVLGTVKGPIYVDNMPFAVDHGPFILLEYDFSYAFQPRWQGADVAFRRTVLTLDGAGALTVQGHGERPQDADSRTPVSLELCLSRQR